MTDLPEDFWDEPEVLPAIQHRKWSPQLADRILEIIHATGNVSTAADACGISRSTVYYRSRTDPEFGAKFKEAMRATVENVIQTSLAVATDPNHEAYANMSLAWLRLRGEAITRYFDDGGDGLDTGGIAGLSNDEIDEALSPEQRANLFDALTTLATYRAQKKLEAS